MAVGQLTPRHLIPPDTGCHLSTATGFSHNSRRYISGPRRQWGVTWCGPGKNQKLWALTDHHSSVPIHQSWRWGPDGGVPDSTLTYGTFFTAARWLWDMRKSERFIHEFGVWVTLVAQWWGSFSSLTGGPCRGDSFFFFCLRQITAQTKNNSSSLNPFFCNRCQERWLFWDEYHDINHPAVVGKCVSVRETFKCNLLSLQNRWALIWRERSHSFITTHTCRWN